MLKVYLALLFSFALLLVVSANDELCCICPDCEEIVPGRQNLGLVGERTCCGENSRMMFEFEPDSQACANLQKRYYDPCCNADFPVDIPQNAEPTNDGFNQNKQDEYTPGDNAVCELCYENKIFPTKPKNLLVFLFFAEPNKFCEDLYYMGQTRNIEDRYCRVVQDESQDLCGCVAETKTITCEAGDYTGSSCPPGKKLINGECQYPRDKGDYKLDPGRPRGQTRRKLLRGQ